MNFVITWNKHGTPPYTADKVCARTIIHPHGIACVQVGYWVAEASDWKSLAVTPASGSIVGKTLFDSRTDQELKLTTTARKLKKQTE